jgi:hypothetical protein
MEDTERVHMGERIENLVSEGQGSLLWDEAAMMGEKLVQILLQKLENEENRTGRGLEMNVDEADNVGVASDSLDGLDFGKTLHFLESAVARAKALAGILGIVAVKSDTENICKGTFADFGDNVHAGGSERAFHPNMSFQKVS